MVVEVGRRVEAGEVAVLQLLQVLQAGPHFIHG